MRHYRLLIKQSRILSSFSWPSYQVVVVGIGYISLLLSFVFTLPFSQPSSATQVQPILPAVPTQIVVSIFALVWTIYSVWFLHKMRLAISGELEKEMEMIWKQVIKKLEDKLSQTEASDSANEKPSVSDVG